MSRSWPLDGSANNCRVGNGGRKCFKKVSTRHWMLLLNIDQKVTHEKCTPNQNWKFCGKTKFGYFGPSEKGEVLVWLSWGPWDHYSDLPPPQPPAATRPTAQRLYKAHFLSFLVLWEHLLWIHQIRRHGDNNDFALGSMAGLKKLMIMMESLPLGDFELSKEKSNY